VKAERSGSGEIMRHVTPLYFPDNLETARLTAPALPTRPADRAGAADLRGWCPIGRCTGSRPSGAGLAGDSPNLRLSLNV
jgi:hypothetical protein